MRKFFCLSAGLAACSVAGLASADRPEPVPLDNAINVQPIRMAKVSPDGKLLTPWFYTKDAQGLDTNCQDDLVFDAYEPDNPDDVFPIGGDECPNLQPSSRWFFGTSFCNTWAVNDIDQYADLAQPSLGSDHAAFAWFNFGDGNPNNSEQTFLAIFTYGSVDKTCNGPAASDPLGDGGLVFDFGELQNNGPGYFFTNLTACDFDLGWDLPAAGEGGYDIQMWNFFDGSNFEFSTCAQPMLWGAKDPATQGNSTGTQWDDQWDIDENGNCTTDPNGNCLNIPDGMHVAPFECFDYEGLVTCPSNPVGAMAAFFGSNEPPFAVTLEVDRLIGGLTSTWTVSNGDPGEQAAVVFGTREGQTNVNGQFGFCASFGIRGVTPDSVIPGCRGQLDGNGEFQCQARIPVGAVGQRVLMQAAQAGTCPDPGESNLLDMTVQ